MRHLNSLAPGQCCSEFRNLERTYNKGKISWAPSVRCMNAQRAHLWFDSIGSGNALMPLGSRPLPKSMVTGCISQHGDPRPQSVNIFMHKFKLRIFQSEYQSIFCGYSLRSQMHCHSWVEQFKEHLHFVDSAAIERVCSRRALLILSEIGLWRVALLRLASLVRLLLLNLAFFNAVRHTQNVTDRNLVRGYEATNTAGVQVNSILVKGVMVDLFHGKECYDGRWRFRLTQLTNIFVHFILVGVSGLVWTKFAWEWLTKKYMGIWKFVTAFGQECSCDGNSFFYWGLSLGQIVASHLQDNHRGVESWGFDIVEGALYCFVFECDHLGGFILVDFVGLDLQCVGIPNNRQIRIVTVSRAWTGIGCRMWAVNGMRV